MARAPLALALSIAFSNIAHADESARLGDVTITYDSAVWKLTELSGVAAMSFTCIAPDCEGEPAIYATATAADAEDAGEIGLDPRPVADPTSPPPDAVPFAATSAWSGCRARTADNLSAVAVVGGTRYRLSTLASIGCSRLPEMPVDRFFELLHGIVAVGPE